MVELVDGLARGLEVPLRAFLLQGTRRKAVAGRHALSYEVLRLVFGGGIYH
jgi:hypothetical protein